MISEKRQAYLDARAELARRSLVERFHDGRIVLRVPFGMVGGVREHVLTPAMLDFGFPWGQLEDQGTHQLIHVSGVNRRTLPKQIGGAGVSVIGDARDVDWARLLPAFAAEPVGHSSQQHTQFYVGDSFTHTNNPLSNHADWNAPFESGAGIKSDGAKVVCNAANTNSRYPYNLANMTGKTADYSVEAVLSSTYTGAKFRNAHVMARGVDNNNLYFLSNNPNTTTVNILKRVGGVQTNISAATTNYANSVPWRLQVIGTILTAWVNGLLNVDILDTGVSAAGSAGIGVYQDANATGSAYIDDFAVYVEAVGGGGDGGARCYGSVT